MLKQAGLLVAGLLLGGCTATTQVGETRFHEFDHAETASSRQMAYTAEFPKMKASDDLSATALIDADQIKIINNSDQDFVQAKVWVNERYVGRLDRIPAHGTATISMGNLWDNDGYTPVKVGAKVDKVYIESQDHLYLLKGPVQDK